VNIPRNVSDAVAEHHGLKAKELVRVLGL